jgi:ATP-dependent Clp protease ATP-binding subunit ClpC
MIESDQFGHLTKPARRALLLAEEEARRLGHNSIGPEHLLLGLAHEGGGVATRVLYDSSAGVPQLRAAVEAIIQPAEARVGSTIALTPRAKKIVMLAAEEAARRHQPAIGPEHLLLGIVQEGEGLAATVLRNLDISLERLRAQILASISPPDDRPRSGMA